MESLDTASMLRLVAAFCVVLGLMGGLAFLLRYLNSRTLGSYGAKRRLRIIEALPIDHKRKAVILQCDEAEHLIILGHENETVVETHLESSENRTTQKDTKDAKQDKRNKIFPVK